MSKVVRNLFGGCIVLWNLWPFVWQWNTSLKPTGLVAKLPPIWASPLTLENYRSVLRNEGFLKVILNSLIVSIGATLVSLGVGALGAFGVSRLMRRRQDIVMLALLVVFMLPQVSVVTPFYKVLAAFHLKDTLTGLVLVYSVFTVPLVVWVMVQVFDELPVTLYHAARVDGCRPWKIFSRVYLPLGVSGLISAGLLSMIFCWNEFLFALTYTASFASRTIPVGITLFSGQYDFPWGEITAASMVVTVPIILIVILAQKYLVRGLTGSGLKG